MTFKVLRVRDVTPASVCSIRSCPSLSLHQTRAHTPRVTTHLEVWFPLFTWVVLSYLVWLFLYFYSVPLLLFNLLPCRRNQTKPNQTKPHQPVPVAPLGSGGGEEAEGRGEGGEGQDSAQRILPGAKGKVSRLSLPDSTRHCLGEECLLRRPRTSVVFFFEKMEQLTEEGTPSETAGLYYVIVPLHYLNVIWAGRVQTSLSHYHAADQ